MPGNVTSALVANVLLVVSIIAVFGAITALRPPRTERHPLRRPPWLVAMLTAELIPIRVIIWGTFVLVAVSAGALERRAGRVGLWLTLITWALYAVLLVRARTALPAVAAALAEIGLTSPPRRRIDAIALMTSNPYRIPRDVARIPDLEYAPGLGLDLYRRRSHDGSPAPTLVHIHGGGWRGGNRRQQGRPLIHRMASAGWIVASVSYPLVPRATFPDQLVALKRALAWLRSAGLEHGVDPRRIYVTGGSAGAHLAALTALTAQRAEYQPRFESADTSVQGVVTLYGIYDFLNRNGTRDPWPVIPRGVMKASPRRAEDRYRAASPIDQVHEAAPPFFVLHGTHDSLVSIDESRHFVEALRRRSRAPVAFAPIPAATHAFDIVPSLRTQLTVAGIAHFLETLASGHTAVPGEHGPGYGPDGA